MACHLKVDARDAGGQAGVGWTLDLSLGGACLEVPTAFVVGHRLRLRLYLPGAPQPLEAEGDIRWVRDLAGGRYIVGLSLLALPSGGAAALREFLDGLP